MDPKFIEALRKKLGNAAVEQMLRNAEVSKQTQKLSTLHKTNITTKPVNEATNSSVEYLLSVLQDLDEMANEVNQALEDISVSDEVRQSIGNAFDTITSEISDACDSFMGNKDEAEEMMAQDGEDTVEEGVEDWTSIRLSSSEKEANNIKHVVADTDKLDDLQIGYEYGYDDYGNRQYYFKKNGKVISVYQRGWDKEKDAPLMSVRSVGPANDAAVESFALEIELKDSGRQQELQLDYVQRLAKAIK